MEEKKEEQERIAASLRDYQEFCKLTAKKFEVPEHEIFAWGLGIAGEAGDVAGCIKKTSFHGNDQKQGVRENIGDVMWYAAMICNYYGWTLQDILNENLDKLKARYPNGFNIKDASRGNTRIDWQEDKIAGKS
jgi:NTP pyrophosphatase (non-canonical NTP hydrolase)